MKPDYGSLSIMNNQSAIYLRFHLVYHYYHNMMHSIFCPWTVLYFRSVQRSGPCLKCPGDKGR